MVKALQVLAGVFLAVRAAHAGLPLEIDGAWYSPAQSGHGLSIERIDAARALVFWHVFDRDGDPLTLYMEARIEGDSMLGTAYAPQGMRFGSFNPTELRMPPWGELRIAFVDCTRAELHYEALDAHFGRGSMPLVRLLLPRDSDCSLDAPADLRGFAGSKVMGHLAGAYVDPAAEAQAHAYVGNVHGLVDAAGTIYAAVAPTELHHHVEVMIARGQAAPAGKAHFSATVQPSGWLDALNGRTSSPASSRDVFEFDLTVRGGENRRAAGALVPANQGAGGPSGYLELYNPLRESLRPGTYLFSGGVAAVGPYHTLALDVDATDRLCVRGLLLSECLFEGRVTRRAGNDQPFEFELREVGRPTPAFIGIGQAKYSQPLIFDPGDSLLMLGSNGETGLHLYSTSYTPPRP